MEWFASYLNKRFKCVQVEPSFSPFFPVPWGFPQGSILHPLILLLFINELPESIKSTNNTEETQNNGTPDVDEDAVVIIYNNENNHITADKDTENR